MKIEKYYKFLGKDWALLLEPFLLSEEYALISKTLLEQRALKYEIAPRLQDIFNPFLECPLHKLHTVIIAYDPYNGTYVDGKCIADGLAFSVRANKHLPRQLELIYKLIDASIYNNENTSLTDTYDLRKWAHQGILLLNANLTVRIGYSGTHSTMWNNFNKFLIKQLTERKDSLAIALVGRYAHKYNHLFTNPTHKIFECEHPEFGFDLKTWVHNDIFKKIHDFQKEKNNIEIIW